MKWTGIYSLIHVIGACTRTSLIQLHTRGGGGGGSCDPRHQTGSQNSRTLSPRVSKISDFFFMLLGYEKLVIINIFIFV